MSEETRLPLPSREAVSKAPSHGASGCPDRNSRVTDHVSFREEFCDQKEEGQAKQQRAFTHALGSRSMDVLPKISNEADDGKRATKSCDLSSTSRKLLLGEESCSLQRGLGGSEDNLLWRVGRSMTDSESCESSDQDSSSDGQAVNLNSRCGSRLGSKSSGFKFSTSARVEHIRSEPARPLRRRGSLLGASGLQIEVTRTRSENSYSQPFTDDGWDLPGPAPRRAARVGRRLEEERDLVIEQLNRFTETMHQHYAQQGQKRISRRSRRYKTAPSAIACSPTSPPSVGSTEEKEPLKPVVIFDWDDTLFPTWFVTEVIQSSMPAENKYSKLKEDSPHFAALSAHAQLVHDTLAMAASLASVAIVTLAARPWVDNSAEWFLPGLDLPETLENLEIPVFYAREHVRKRDKLAARVEEGVDLFTIAKRNAMKRCLRQLCPNAVQNGNVICIGDSTTEELAIKEIMWSDDIGMAHCKTIKLLDDPNLEVLGMELQLVTSWFEKMIPHNEDFHICLNEAGKTLAWE